MSQPILSIKKVAIKEKESSQQDIQEAHLVEHLFQELQFQGFLIRHIDILFLPIPIIHYIMVLMEDTFSFLIIIIMITMKLMFIPLIMVTAQVVPMWL
jgi:hypothetical protein